MKLLNDTWELQTLNVFAMELKDLCMKEFSVLYPMIRYDKGYADNSNKRIYQYGAGQDYIELELKKTEPKGNVRPVTKFKINLRPQNWQGKVQIDFERDSRFFTTICKTPIFLFECLLDELENYFSTFMLYKGMNKNAIIMSPKSGYRNDWTDNEIVLINNFSIVSMEPIWFLIPGKLDVPEENSVFEYVLALLMKPYLFSDKIFKTQHFSFIFYNDKRSEAYIEWKEKIFRAKGII